MEERKYSFIELVPGDIIRFSSEHQDWEHGTIAIAVRQVRTRPNGLVVATLARGGDADHLIFDPTCDALTLYWARTHWRLESIEVLFNRIWVTTAPVEVPQVLCKKS